MLFIMLSDEMSLVMKDKSFQFSVVPSSSYISSMSRRREDGCIASKILWKSELASSLYIDDNFKASSNAMYSSDCETEQMKLLYSS